MQPSFFGFYGSLRRGMGLHKEFEQHLQYLFSFWLEGYQMYSLGPYPCIVKSHDLLDKVLMEIYRIDDETTKQAIHEIEKEAGYLFTQLVIDGLPVTVFYFENAANYLQVKEGDWVQFFRS